MSEFSRIRGSEPSAGQLAAIMFTPVVFGGFSQKGTINAASFVCSLYMAPSISNILQALHTARLNIVDVIQGLYDLCDAKYAAAYLPPPQIPQLLSLLYTKKMGTVRAWLLVCAEDIYVGEVRSISRPGFGLWLNATHLEAQKVESFDIQGLASRFEAEVPPLWGLINSMLAADPSTKHGAAPHRKREQNKAQFGLHVAAGPSINTTAVNESAEDSGDEDESFDEDQELLEALHISHGLPLPAGVATGNADATEEVEEVEGTATGPSPGAAALMPVVRIH